LLDSYEKANREIITALTGLAAGAEAISGTDAAYLHSCSQLFALGGRRCKNWLSPVEDLPPRYFGLENPKTFLSLISDEHIEFKIFALRRLAETYALDSSEMVIRYKYTPPRNSYRTLYAYATVSAATKRKRDEGLHRRWFSIKHLKEEEVSSFLAERAQECGEDCENASNSDYDAGEYGGNPGTPPELGETERFFHLPITYYYVAGDYENTALWCKNAHSSTFYPDMVIPYDMIICALQNLNFDFPALFQHILSFLMGVKPPEPSEFSGSVPHHRDIHVLRITKLGLSLNALAHAVYVFHDTSEALISFSCTDGNLYKHTKWLQGMLNALLWLPAADG
jgi:hypothetical protein